MADLMSIDKKDPTKDESEESMDSSPDAEQSVPNSATPKESQPQKRKGGRKPIYATSEERKQRNRQAQAAFRERRTEYIKQLEETIRAHENNLNQLQAAHRSAADECLMLRYKNSLLERILLEKGIDVQAELHAKTGSPNLGPTHVPQNLVQPPIQRAIMKRHHQARRSASSIQPKLEPGVTAVPPIASSHLSTSSSSPKNRPTPSSHAASPASTTAAPGFGAAGPGGSVGGHSTSSPASSDHPNSTMRPKIPPIKTSINHVAAIPPPGRSMMSGIPPMRVGGAGGGPTNGPFYQNTSFQSHLEQLEQEYESQDNHMIDEPEVETPSGPSPYPVYSNHDSQQLQLSPTTTGPPVDTLPPIGMQLGHHNHHHHHSHSAGFPSMSQLLDTSLDFDPFGLSASMQFPTFSFDTSNMR